MTKIYDEWCDRIDSGTLTKGQCSQFVNFIARCAEGYTPHGRKTNLTGDECVELVRRLVRRGGVRLTTEHTDQGVNWLAKYAHKIFGPELADEINAKFSHFLFLGDFRVYGTYYNGTLPVWRIVLTDGRMFDYWNAAWQVGAFGEDGGRSYEEVPSEVTA